MNLRRFPATREISIGVLFYLYLPVLVLIIYSFNGNRTATIWTEASLHWYGRILENPSIQAATWNSLVLAFAAGIGATLIALLAALATKNHFRGIGGIEAMINAPLILPEVVSFRRDADPVRGIGAEPWTWRDDPRPHRVLHTLRLTCRSRRG